MKSAIPWSKKASINISINTVNAIITKKELLVIIKENKIYC